MADRSGSFAKLLRDLRAKTGLTQEELAEAASRSPRQISDLERGVVTTPQRSTVRLLADALKLDDAARADFEAAARGHVGTGPAGSRTAAGATRTLPRDVASFTGRKRELAELTAAVASRSGAVTVNAIGGMAGIGKTAFAVHAAHQLASQFPEGQIFLPLHGHTPGRQPVRVNEALASLLLTIGVPAGQIPADLEARTAVWRDRLAGRPLLLVLDDAASSEQIRPLLPGGGGSLVLITSRRRHTALEDAATVSLDALPCEEAAALLVRVAGRPELGPADPAVRELTRLCGGLPLAIGMLARQLHHHPAWTVAARVAELATVADRLGSLATENLSVATAFDLSYGDLASDRQRLFRRLGLYPGTEIDLYAAAALDDTSPAEAGRGLDALYEHYLLTETARGRYRMHDLIREHAEALARREDPEGVREQATGRLLDYYQRAAAHVDSLLVRRARTTAPPAGGSASAAIPVLADRWQALKWARAERATVLACVDLAHAAGQDARVVSLTAGLAGLLRYDGPWDEAITRHAAAVQIARQLGDRQAQATGLTDLGDVRQLKGDYAAAAADLAEALSIGQEIGDRPGQAGALTILGIVRRLTGDHQRAVRDLTEALDICREIGDRPGQARVLLVLGDEWRLAGNYRTAARDLQDGMSICREIGDRIGEAGAVANLGDVRRLTGDYRAAAGDLREALRICQEIGHRLGQANVRASLGLVCGLTGDHATAMAELQAALGIYRDLGDRLGQARSLRYLGEVRLVRRDYADAAHDLRAALGIHRDLGSRPGQAETLTYLGMVRRLTGDYSGAARDVHEALDIYGGLGNEHLAITALNELGTLSRVRGDIGQAQSLHQQALDRARQIGHVLQEAHAEAGLGRCAVAAGDAIAGERRLRKALAICQRIGVVYAADLSAELDALGS